MKRFYIVSLILTAINALMVAQVTVTAKLDSATLLMGKTTALHIEILQPQDAHGRLIADAADTLSATVEIAERLKALLTDQYDPRLGSTQGYMQ